MIPGVTPYQAPPEPGDVFISVPVPAVAGETYVFLFQADRDYMLISARFTFTTLSAGACSHTLFKRETIGSGNASSITNGSWGTGPGNVTQRHEPKYPMSDADALIVEGGRLFLRSSAASTGMTEAGITVQLRPV